MKGRWWIAVVAVVGLVLAVVLMPKPDTGGDVEVVQNGGNEVAPGTVTSPRAALRERPPVDPNNVRTGPKPGMERFIEQRNRPEVVYSGKMLAPFSAMRYVLVKDGSAEAKAMADELAQGVMADLRGVRSAEDARAAMDAVEPKAEAEAAKIEASAWGKDETIQKSLVRYRGLVAEYHQALDSQGVPTTPAEPTPDTPEEEP